MIGKKNIFRTITTPEKSYVINFSRTEEEGLIGIFTAGADGTLKHVMDLDAAKLPDPKEQQSSFRLKILSLIRDAESPTSIYTIATRNTQYQVDLKHLPRAVVLTQKGNQMTPLAEIQCPFTVSNKKNRTWLVAQLSLLDAYLKARELINKSPVKVLPAAASVSVAIEDSRRTTTATTRRPPSKSL